MEDFMVIYPKEFIKYGRWNRRRGVVVGFILYMALEPAIKEVLKQGIRQANKQKKNEIKTDDSNEKDLHDK